MMSHRVPNRDQLPSGVDFDTQLTTAKAGCAPAEVFTAVDNGVWKLPEVCPPAVCRALYQQNASRPLNNDTDFRDRQLGRHVSRRWDVPRDPLCTRRAQPSHWTGVAIRRCGGTYQGPELHERLVKSSNLPAGEKSLRSGPEPRAKRASPWIFATPEDSAQDPLAVRFQDRQSAFVCLRQNGADHVPADAGEIGERSRIVWNSAPVPGLDQARGAMKVSGAPIIAQPFPDSEDFLLISFRQIAQGRKRMKETLEVRDDSRNLGLLQHDLADPDAIRISILPPREAALMREEPL